MLQAMVCKEEVFMWFKELTGSKRIGVMCGLLNMCYPLELRFFGTCLEDLGKKDFYCFQDAEQKANNVNEVKKLTDLKDNVTRCKFIVSLALLHSSNHVCSNVLYQTLTKHLERFELFSEDKTSNEMMLVLTMALNHPAFTFDQKTVLTQQLLSAEKLIGEANQTNHESHTWRRCASAVIPDSIHQATVSACQNVSSPTTSIMASATVASVAHTVTAAAVTTSGTPCHHHHQVSFRANDTSNQARISSLKCKGTHKRRSYRIRVSWTNGKYTEVSKTCHEIVVFHQKLLQLFPQDVFSNGREKYIPPLPGIIAGQSEEITEESISALNDFLRQLTMHLPVNILECEHVTSFFKSPLYGRSGIRGGKYFPNDSFTEDGVRVPSITIYNSHRADGSSRAKNMQHNSPNNHGSPAECSHGQQQISTPPARSPVSSPVSSPYISPPQSGTSSRSASPWIQRPVSSVTEEKTILGLEQLLRREHLLEYWEKLKPYKLEELQGMGLEKFEHIGISKPASTKLRKLLDSLRSCSGQNGVKSLLPVIQSTSHHATILPAHSPINQISSESSPSCSEYSSPPPSPPPSESPRQQNSERTSSEESLHDKGGTSAKLEAEIVQDSEDKHCCSNKHSEVKVDENQWSKDNWPILAATPPPIGYVPTVTHIHPHVQKPNHLPAHSKASPAPLGSSTVIFENGQYTNLPSALSFLSHNNIQRSHSSTPERALPVSTVVTVPVTTICPFPVVTSGCTTPTSCMTTYRNSGTATVTTAVSLSNNRHPCPKNLNMGRENDGNHKLHQQSDVISAHYTLTPAYLLPPSAVSAHPSQPATCAGVCTVTSTIVASSVLSSPSTPGTPQQTHHTVSLPFSCVGFLPHIFPPQTFPFIQTHGNSPANGLISPAMTPPPSVHSFPFPIANSIPPELMYARQSFPIPPPSPNPNSVPSNPAPSPVPAASSPGSATYSSVNACYSKPTQSNGNTNSGKISCFNCGKFGHRGSDCKDASLNDGRNYTRPVCKNGNS